MDHRTLAALAATFLAHPAFAQVLAPVSEPSITVTGEGRASRAPDFVRVGFQARGEGRTAVEALTALSQQRTQVEAGIQRLKGVRDVRLTASQVTTTDVRSPACAPSNQRESARERLTQGDCIPIGVIATLDLEARVAPAERAGDVASIAAQLGARFVAVRGTGLEADDTLQAEASEKAVIDARQTAQRLAVASGGRLGKILRVQEGMLYDGGLPPLPVPPISGTPPPPPPPPPPLAVPLAFASQPIVRTARVTLVYALEAAP